MILFILRERGSEGDREKEKHQLAFSWTHLDLQPRHVPWLGIKPVTFCCVGTIIPNRLSHTTQGSPGHFCIWYMSEVDTQISQTFRVHLDWISYVSHQCDSIYLGRKRDRVVGKFSSHMSLNGGNISNPRRPSYGLHYICELVWLLTHLLCLSISHSAQSRLRNDASVHSGLHAHLWSRRW